MAGFRGSFSNLQALMDSSQQKPHRLGSPKQMPMSLDGAPDQEPASKKAERLVMVSMKLPLSMKKATGEDGKSPTSSSGWVFEVDKDALLVQASSGVEAKGEGSALHVGCLPVEVPAEDQDAITVELREQFNFVPVFLGESLKQKYYSEFCKRTLWPLLHYLLPLSSASSGRFKQETWQAYMKANRVFVDKLMQFLRPETDNVWIHDYHLMVLPALLRKRSCKVKCGFFLHCPFPSSEIFRAFPKREEVLRSFLAADLLGFQTFDYARHFLSCCARQLGVEHETDRGSIVLNYFGRKVHVMILPTGVQPERLLECNEWADTTWRRGELLEEYKDKTILLGMDDLDIFKGIKLKLAAFEFILEMHQHLRSKLVLIQVVNPARSDSSEVQLLRQGIQEYVDRINTKYGTESHKPVVWLDRSVPHYERVALYSVADCAVVTASRDGMNLMPYEYIVCRQGSDSSPGPRQSTLVVSEFVGCSPSLSGALRVNPWSVESVSDGILQCISMSSHERAMRHDKHWKYVSRNTAGHWATSYLHDLRRACVKHSSMKFYGLGLGLDTFRMVALDLNFRKLDVKNVDEAFSSSQSRLFLLDYDQTLMTTTSFSAHPSEMVLETLTQLAEDENNTVVIVSGRGRNDLESFFGSVKNVGLVAEHGFFYCPPGSGKWETHQAFEPAWKDVVLPVLEHYVECTDGSYVEKKESALVWHYQDTDPDFGSWQAKELLDHLESVLANEPVEAVRGNGIIEVKPQGSSKGTAADMVLSWTKSTKGEVDFVFCVGDDRSDEEMFRMVDSVAYSPHMPAEVFACTVGAKPSKAPFYLDDPVEVISMLRSLAARKVK